MTKFTLTPRALRDLDAITEFSIEKWGAGQTEIYLAEIKARCAWLAEHPMLGRARDDIAPGYRSFRQGADVIYYVIERETLVVVGVPHSARDVSTYFGG